MLGALFASPLFCNLGLAAAAIALCFLYAHEGTRGILLLAHQLRADLFIRPDFSRGLIVGAVVAFVVFGLYQRKSS